MQSSEYSYRTYVQDLCSSDSYNLKVATTNSTLNKLYFSIQTRLRCVPYSSYVCVFPPSIVITMLQNGNNLSEGWPSFCSSCKSDLRSFFSIGVPSYLDESVSSISSYLQDTSQSQVTDIENKTKQSIYEIKICNQDKSYHSKDSEWDNDKNGLSSNLQLESTQLSLKYINESFSSTKTQWRVNKENIFTNLAYQTRQLNNVIHKPLYGFINLKNRTEVVNNLQNTCQKLFENLKSFNTIKSCDFDTQETTQRLKSVVNMRGLDRWKEIHDIILWKRNVKIQAIASKAFVDPEMTGTDLGNRRKNVYKLAVQVAKLSEFLLKKENVNKLRTRKDNIKVHGSPKNNAIKSGTNRNTPQDLFM